MRITSVLAFLLLASSLCFANIVIEGVSKERAKQLGVTIHAKVVGTNQVGVWLEFPRAGKLQTITSVTLEITSLGQSLVSAPLSPLKQAPDSIVYYFSTDPAYLRTSTVTVMNKSTGWPPYDGLRFNIGVFVTHESLAGSLSDKSNVSGGWLRSFTLIAGP